MERNLYEAALSGNVHYLNKAMKEDPLILDRVTLTCFNETPLHISAMRGHLDFTMALLSLKPKLAIELDSLGRSPLHLASAEGYVKIVREILGVNNHVCLVRDHDGWIPLHLAAMKGRVGVMQELIRARPESVMERVERGETAFHLCVKHNSLEALKLLVETTRYDGIVCYKDGDGNTILHVAAALKQMETVKYLLSRRGIKENVNDLNGNGFTALDVLEHYPRDLKGMEIRELLHEAGVQRARDLKIVPLKRSALPPPPPREALIIETPVLASPSFHRTWKKARQLLVKIWKLCVESDDAWLEDARGNLMVVATLTAAMAFQAGINPPWDELGSNPPTTNHVAGQFILFFNYSDPKAQFLAYNTISYVASLIVILLMISGIPLKNKVSLWLLVSAMCLTISFTAFTYIACLDIIATDRSWERVDQIYTSSLLSCIVVFLFVLLIHTARLLTWIVYNLHELAPKAKLWLAAPVIETPVTV